MPDELPTIQEMRKLALEFFTNTFNGKLHRDFEDSFDPETKQKLQERIHTDGENFLSLLKILKTKEKHALAVELEELADDSRLEMLQKRARQVLDESFLGVLLRLLQTLSKEVGNVILAPVDRPKAQQVLEQSSFAEAREQLRQSVGAKSPYDMLFSITRLLRLAYEEDLAWRIAIYSLREEKRLMPPYAETDTAGEKLQ